MKRNLLILGVILLCLFTSNIYAQEPSNENLYEISNQILETLEKNGLGYIGVNMRSKSGVVDFDFIFDSKKPTDDKFYIEASSIVGIIASLTNGVSWKSNRINFRTNLDYETFAWIEAKDCRNIMTINDQNERKRAIKEKIHIIK